MALAIVDLGLLPSHLKEDDTFYYCIEQFSLLFQNKIQFFQVLGIGYLILNLFGHLKFKKKNQSPIHEFKAGDIISAKVINIRKLKNPKKEHYTQYFLDLKLENYYEEPLFTAIELPSDEYTNEDYPINSFIQVHVNEDDSLRFT